MAIVEADPQAGERVRELDKQYVLHSWSVQDAISPLPVAGAEGCYFWDYDGKRYLDFASQLVNVSIRPEQRHKWLELIRTNAAQTRAEEGCESSRSARSSRRRTTS